ncbi:MAG: DUF86 domain-containing protein [Holophagales bacterium]|nr:MAG: DUF86 domain-containing protein [Holophagales bacterium]
MLPESRSALEKVVELAALLDDRIAGRSLPDYENDGDLQAIAERHLITIGEALARVARKDPALFAQLPEGREVVDFRNVLVHGYDIIDQEVVWSALTQDLQRLAAAARALLQPL